MRTIYPMSPQTAGKNRTTARPARAFAWKVVWVNIVLIGLVLASAELIWGGWFDTGGMRKICRYVLCSANYRYQSKFTGATSYMKDDYGLRGRAMPQSDIHIAVVGGSTSDQRKLNNDQTWDWMLEQKLAAAGRPMEIVNAGIDGQSTFGHIWNFRRWFPAIPNFRPQYFLFYIGINDLTPKVNTKRHDNVHDLGVIEGTLEAIRNNSLFYELYHTIKGMQEAVRNRTHHDSARAEEPYTVAFDPARNDWAFYQQHYLDKQFVDRLKHLVNLSASLNARPIFVSQRSARWTTRNGRIIGAASGKIVPRTIHFKGKPFTFTNADLGYAERLLSQTLMGFCQAQNLLCFDGFSNFQIDKSTTYDLVHTTPRGSAEIASKLYQFLNTHLP